MRTFKTILFSALITLVAGLAGCGGGGNSSASSGIGGTGKIASGSITRFGSIFVNGVEYDIDMASCSVDDNDVTGNCQANLSIGMVVTVEGIATDTQGTASSVVFDADVEGPVSSLATQPDGLTRTFSILGVPVIVDTATTRFDDSATGFSFDTLADGNLVKVSGFADPTGVLQATYIRKVADSVVLGTSTAKIKGSVANLAGGGGAGSSFVLNGVTVSILSGTDLSELPGNVVSNGERVSVNGILTGAASLDAGNIDPDSLEIGEDGDDVSIEGLVSGFTGNLSSFLVDGHNVDAGTAQIPSGLQLANGIRVEVEGVISGGTLVASDIASRNDEIKIDAPVTVRTSGSLTLSLGFASGTLSLGSLTVNVDNQTRIEDSDGGIENPLLSDINPGDFVQIRGYQDSSGITATEIHRETPDDVLLQGPVESFTSGSDITVLGITFFTDSGTEFDDTDDASISGGTFYGALAIGDNVKIEDNRPGDGTADEVDQEN
jgi:hypothetical protein